LIGVWFFLIVIEMRLIAAGVTPSNRPACPSVEGCDLVSLSTTSLDRPVIILKFMLLGILVSSCLRALSTSRCCLAIYPWYLISFAALSNILQSTDFSLIIFFISSWSRLVLFKRSIAGVVLSFSAIFCFLRLVKNVSYFFSCV